MSARLGRLVIGIVWLAIIVLLAFGSAGLVAGLDHPPSGDARPELTWAGDAAIHPGLEAATDDLTAIAADVERLGMLGRGALAALAGREFDTLDATISEGGPLVLAIRDRSESLQSTLAAMPGMGPLAELSLSRETRDRHARLAAAVDATDGLAADWARLSSGAISAARLSAFLEDHDQTIVSAIDAGRAGRFDDALKRVATATTALHDAEKLRDRLANTVDVATLNEWLRRNLAYDEALTRLYQASKASPTRVTPAIRAALKAEQAARNDLPKTTKNLVIIMSEIARGGLNQAVIAIEEARGRLASALAGLGVEPAPVEEPSGEPSVTPEPSTPDPGPS